ncbi:MAG: hypothetical protein IKL52_00045 [Candidatus Gastranaerophilales bacterium]|nr:hypothetical protein [Candidatus Gastranaerophilales bacterium]
MEQVGVNNIQQVQYQPKVAVTEPSFQGKKPEMKEDGDKKLLGALAGLAAIGAGVMAVVDLKKGDASHIKKVWNKITKKTPKTGAKAIEAAKATTQRAAEITKEAIEEKIADGQIGNLSDALQICSRKQLEDFGLYSKLAESTYGKVAKEMQEAIGKNNPIKEAIEEQLADGQIENLADAIKKFGEKAVKDSGMYDILSKLK